MNVVQFFEQLACNASHQLDLATMLKGQSADVQQALLTNNSAIIKNMLSGSALLADRTTVATA